MGVETLFREWKTQYELDEFDTNKEHNVRILLYAALLSLLVSRNLVTEQADVEIVFPPERWAATVRSNAELIHHGLGECLGYSLPPGGAADRRCTEDPQATTNIIRDARYHNATEMCVLAKDEWSPS